MREKSKPPGLARKTPTRRCLVKLNPEKKRARERCLIISQTDGLVNRTIGRTPSSASAMSLAHLARAKYERPETTTNKQKKSFPRERVYWSCTCASRDDCKSVGAYGTKQCVTARLCSNRKVGKSTINDYQNDLLKLTIIGTGLQSDRSEMFLSADGKGSEGGEERWTS